jgi:hypothetical protein
LRLEILTLERQVSYLRLDLLDLLLPVLKDEQLLQFRLHARMLWAERSAVNRGERWSRRALAPV